MLSRQVCVLPPPPTPLPPSFPRVLCSIMKRCHDCQAFINIPEGQRRHCWNCGRVVCFSCSTFWPKSTLPLLYTLERYEAVSSWRHFSLFVHWCKHGTILGKCIRRKKEQHFFNFSLFCYESGGDDLWPPNQVLSSFNRPCLFRKPALHQCASSKKGCCRVSLAKSDRPYVRHGLETQWPRIMTST